MKKLVIIFLGLVLLFACNNNERAILCDTGDCGGDLISTDTAPADVANTDAEETTLCSQGEAIDLSKSEVVPMATIESQFGTIKMASAEGGGPAEKTQFDVILKSAGTSKSSSDGTFEIKITEEDLKRLPEEFAIMFSITPPEGFNKEVKTSKAIVPFYNYKITSFNFELRYIDGSFIVTPLDQLNRITIKRKSGNTSKRAGRADTKSTLDAFVNVTTKASMPDTSEPVPGAEITIGQTTGLKVIKGLLSVGDGGLVAYKLTCMEIESLDEIKTISNNEGYFSIKVSDPSNPGNVLISITPERGSSYIYDASNILLRLPRFETDVYDLALAFDKIEGNKGRFIIIGPLPLSPCSSLINPTCEEKKCKLKNGITGKCQYLYNSSTGQYSCGCSEELCNPQNCTGNCKMPDGKEGICHIEPIETNYNGAVIVNKTCVCGPIELGCNISCQTNQDCAAQTANQLSMCATDMNGNKFCTKGCSSTSDCPSPFSMCVKSGQQDRGICMCPCINGDNAQSQCNPIGLYNPNCTNATFGALTDCIDIDNDSVGECTLCCTDDKQCPSGMHCYNLLSPINDKCKKACMCKEPLPPTMCKECKTDQDCNAGEFCVDEDNNPNTPNVCAVPCGAFGKCPTSPVYTYCDYNISRFCICEHNLNQVDCNYECKDNQDCIQNSNGQFDLCMPDMYGHKRCTKSCSDAKDCPSPYSICIQYGDKSYCSCPCTHFEGDDVNCYQQGFNSQTCITKTNNALPDCFDIDNDGIGECTNCCNEDKDCPAGMLCTPAVNAKCDKVCTCKEHPIADVCQRCSRDSDCPSGFVCADDDNNNATPNVCTRVCPSIYSCPTSPVYTYCDDRVSKYCICNESGTNLCETKCKSNDDCPPGYLCADDDTNPNTPNICTKTCGDCPSPMICNHDANLPVPVCMCPRDYCKSCKEDIECGFGLKCIDSDGDPLTPNVCTLPCTSDYDCPLNLSCNINTKSCDCNRCSRWSNPKCEANTCYKDGVFGKCAMNNERCECIVK